MRIAFSLLTAISLVACASAPPTDGQLAALSDVDACAAAGRAYARNDVTLYSRVLEQLQGRAARASWMGDEQCLTYAQMGARSVQTSEARRVALATAMRQVGQQLQQAGTPPPSIDCTSRTSGATTTTHCD